MFEVERDLWESTCPTLKSPIQAGSLEEEMVDHVQMAFDYLQNQHAIPTLELFSAVL